MVDSLMAASYSASEFMPTAAPSSISNAGCARSAGQRAAIQGTKFGKRVVLVENRDVIGGACINTGKIPSQKMREDVLHLYGVY